MSHCIPLSPIFLSHIRRMVTSSLLSPEVLREGKTIKLPNGQGTAQASDPRPHDVTSLTPRLLSTGTKRAQCRGETLQGVGGSGTGPHASPLVLAHHPRCPQRSTLVLWVCGKGSAATKPCRTGCVCGPPWPCDFSLVPHSAVKTVPDQHPLFLSPNHLECHS